MYLRVLKKILNFRDLMVYGSLMLPQNIQRNIYCGNGVPRRSLQLKVSGQTHEAQTAMNWSLVREKKG